MFKLLGKRILKKGVLFTGGPTPTNRPSQRSQPGPATRASPPSSRSPQRQRRSRARPRQGRDAAWPACVPGQRHDLRLACHHHQRTRHSPPSPVHSLLPSLSPQALTPTAPAPSLLLELSSSPTAVLLRRTRHPSIPLSPSSASASPSPNAPPSALRCSIRPFLPSSSSPA